MKCCFRDKPLEDEAQRENSKESKKKTDKHLKSGELRKQGFTVSRAEKGGGAIQNM
jgi:hypothetical protein